MLDNPAEIDRVCIFLPHPVAVEAIVDCSDYLSGPEIAQGLFNEVLTTTAAPRYLELNGNLGIFCRVHRFIKDGPEIDPTDLAVELIAAGALLTITRQALDEVGREADEANRAGSPPSRAYFRLRIYLDADAQIAFVRRIPTHDRLLQSGFNEIEYIDFSLNEARTLPAQIETQMRNDQGNAVKLKLVAFLTAVPVLSELSVSNTPSHKLRLLEHQLWDPYVPSGIPEGMMVYHWKLEKPTGLADFSAFVKLQTRRSGRKTFCKYLLIAFMFGVLGNLVASALQIPLGSAWNAIVGLGKTIAPTSPGVGNNG
jgi:hypothetical protein